MAGDFPPEKLYHPSRADDDYAHAPVPVDDEGAKNECQRIRPGRHFRMVINNDADAGSLINAITAIRGS